MFDGNNAKMAMIPLRFFTREYLFCQLPTLTVPTGLKNGLF